MTFDDYLNNSACNNINVYMKYHETLVESLKLWQKSVRGYFEFWDEMVALNIKSLENGDGNDLYLQCYNAYTSGYEAAKKDFINEMKKVNIYN